MPVNPRQHVADGMALYQPEWNAVSALLKQRRDELEKADASISGFNIRLNRRASAGQAVIHAHWHVITRRKGDMPWCEGSDSRETALLGLKSSAAC